MDIFCFFVFIFWVFLVIFFVFVFVLVDIFANHLDKTNHNAEVFPRPLISRTESLSLTKSSWKSVGTRCGFFHSNDARSFLFPLCVSIFRSPGLKDFRLNIFKKTEIPQA